MYLLGREGLRCHCLLDQHASSGIDQRSTLWVPDPPVRCVLIPAPAILPLLLGIVGCPVPLAVLSLVVALPLAYSVPLERSLAVLLPALRTPRIEHGVGAVGARPSVGSPTLDGLLAGPG